jgi:transcription-repair coupling factor (superfamily II helicase)
VEWLDRYGPIPDPAEALLMVARLRAECHRVGLRDVTITGTQARLAPLELKTSETMRLRRLARQSIYKEDVGQVVVPLPRGTDPASFLVDFLQQLRPIEPVTSSA